MTAQYSCQKYCKKANLQQKQEHSPKNECKFIPIILSSFVLEIRDELKSFKYYFHKWAFIFIVMNLINLSQYMYSSRYSLL